MAKGQGDRRQKRFSILSAIFSDPVRKLIAIALAILLWHHLDSRVTDGGEVYLIIVESDTATERSTTLRDNLQIRIPKREYSIVQCLDGIGGKPIDGVMLYLEGPKYLMETLAENPGYWVLPLGRGVSDTPEIEVDDIKTINPAYQSLIKGMSPPSVFLQLARNETEVVPLTPDSVDVIAPPNSKGFEDRLVWESATFTESNVELSGPSGVVEALIGDQKLFQWAPAAPAPGNDTVRGALTLLDPSGTVSMTPDQVTMSVILRRPAEKFELIGVPVILTGPLAATHRPRDRTEDITIRAMNNLGGLLDILQRQPEELANWIATKTLLIATSDDVGDGQDTAPSYFKILDNAYVAERDYKLESATPAIDLVKK